MNAIPLDLTPDRGADGPASLARTSRIKVIDARSGGSGKAPAIKTEVRRYECECRLDYLRSRGTIDRSQWKAGMIFRRAWLATRVGAIRTADFGDRVQRSLGPVALDARSEAMFLMDEANRILPAAALPVIKSVCGEDEALEWVAGTRDRRRRSLLVDGLNRLAIVWV